ncbi:monocarboxylate transporter 12-like isoform X2 [Homarus americanus]|uniref:monocarboxylate transporter 12-like isoform X2 n=1 Tax=Homarus americanus TaxID=6706 RepID=UPI001C48DB94|nr:monocarboxylate transporter 12-like isoform X2 [Homarus americanus]XP_042215607.1 monocarboxylate transporter 12-like isoform X2 [Homarus americanus]
MWRLWSACGMNFAYSGQIISLAQYFEKKQSIATSSAMIGIGLGIFFLSSLTDVIISEYGWRGSFIWSASLSLQVAVFGALVFPLQPLAQSPADSLSLQHQTEDNPGSTVTHRGIPSSKSRYFFEKSLNDRSFSSLRLSAAASYLSHSILSLNDSQSNTRRNSHYDLSLRSNQHSFCSRGSHFAIGSIRSNGYSFCTKDSHAELSHFDLRSNQFSFHNKDSHGDFGLQSNNQSFCSRRDSQAGVSGIKSNPQSFSKISQGDIYQHLQVESMKGTCSGHGGGRARFLLREGDCDLGCCVEEEEEFYSSNDEMPTPQNERRSLCMLLIEKMKRRTYTAIKNFSSYRKSSDHPLLDIRFWLLDFAVFFVMVGTLCLYIIYKDFADSKGVGDYYSMALSGIGIGDLCGRMCTGFLMSTRLVDPVFTYGLALLLCAIVMMCHIFISTSTHLLVLTAMFGFLYGSQNVLIAVAPSMVFGREKLITVFGHILFLGGIGALIGAPVAGYIVDSTGSYDGVLFFSVVSLTLGTCLMFMCYFIQRKKADQQQVESV